MCSSTGSRPALTSAICNTSLTTAPRLTHRDCPPNGRSRTRVDLARAFSYVARDDEALDQLLDAEQAAPQIVRHSAAVRDTVKTLHRRARHSQARTHRCLAWPNAAERSQ